MTIWRMNEGLVLRGIALALTLAPGAWAQAGRGGAGGAGGAAGEEDAACTPSRQPHECPDRCPSYDTCQVADEELLYYRVGDQRFDCDGYDCSAASVTLGDYCCRRGEFAPSDDDGGGCALAGAPAPLSAVPLGNFAVGLGCVAGASLWRRRRGMRRGERRRG